MFWTVLIVLIALVCLAGIAAVVVRKFPQLTMIDTAAIPVERDAKRKRQIAEERIDRAMTAFGRRVAELSHHGFDFVRARFRALYNRLLEVEGQFRPRPPRAVVIKRIPELAAEAETLMKEENYEEAEKRFIEILKIDRKDIDAYWGLGTVLSVTKRHAQAAEIYGFLVRLVRRRGGCTHDDESTTAAGKPCAAPAEVHAETAAAFAELGIARKEAGDLPGAKAALASAIAFGGDNPRHLDLLLETCILTGDKSKALRIYERLALANPENQKLPSLAERIEAMPSMK